MEMVNLQQFRYVEEEYNLQDFFPKALPYPLHPLIEYRIKLLLKESIIFVQEEFQLVHTVCILGAKRSLKGVLSKLSMHLIPYENLPLSFK